MLASRSQASVKYRYSRNHECTCNSLTFLAFLHENEHVTSADLDLVLDKGDVMYKQVRKRFPKSIHLAVDELPTKAPAHHCMYKVVKQPARYGTLAEPLTESASHLLDLEAGLSCLLSDVQYALLIMSGLCIAVFRNRSGRYGFLDPHSRRANGLALLVGTYSTGTAVMLTFTHLSDMIDRLVKCHEILGIPFSCVYELTPLQFHNMHMANLCDVIPDKNNISQVGALSLLADNSHFLAPKINTDIIDLSDMSQQIPASSSASSPAAVYDNGQMSYSPAPSMNNDTDMSDYMLQKDSIQLVPFTTSFVSANETRGSYHVHRCTNTTRTIQ